MSFLLLLLLLLSSVLLVVGRCGSILLRLPRYSCAPTGRLSEEVAVLQQLNECIEQNANAEVPKKSGVASMDAAWIGCTWLHLRTGFEGFEIMPILFELVTTWKTTSCC